MVEPDLAVTEIREEREADRAAANAVLVRAFASVRHSRGRETILADGLRDGGGVTLGFVAVAESAVVGSLLVSPVTVNGALSGWHALGPVAVDPDWQGRGVGSDLVREALARLKATGAEGCIVLGARAFYGRFGFLHAPELVPVGLPASAFMVLPFRDRWPEGRLAYHPAFDAI
ncbi:GNAT family N-acetyltransferase [Rubellimicrobium roseum]|nr:N-acetyltransferase [Rubellimicrobium roseum]